MKSQAKEEDLGNKSCPNNWTFLPLRKCVHDWSCPPLCLQGNALQTQLSSLCSGFIYSFHHPCLPRARYWRRNLLRKKVLGEKSTKIYHYWWINTLKKVNSRRGSVLTGNVPPRTMVIALVSLALKEGVLEYILSSWWVNSLLSHCCSELISYYFWV